MVRQDRVKRARRDAISNLDDEVLEGEGEKRTHAHEQHVHHHDEVVVISDADAIVEPWAVMVHSFDTLITDVAVLGSW